MAIIEPGGLFQGERITACSDLAQLYWPRLFVAANSYARLELRYQLLLTRVFASFRTPPSKEELWSVFKDYEQNYLAILYEAGGRSWCQFITHDKYLPRYKRSGDQDTPAPTEEMLRRHEEGYLRWRELRHPAAEQDRFHFDLSTKHTNTIQPSERNEPRHGTHSGKANRHAAAPAASSAAIARIQRAEAALTDAARSLGWGADPADSEGDDPAVVAPGPLGRHAGIAPGPRAPGHPVRHQAPGRRHD